MTATTTAAPPCKHAPARPRTCPACWHWENTPEIRDIWSGLPPPPRAAGPRIALCLHLGDRTRPPSGCADVFWHCDAGHGAVAPCKQCGPARCKDYVPSPDGNPPGPERIVRVPDQALPRGKSGYAFNASLVRFGGKLLMAHRTDWEGARIHLTELAEDYTPAGPSRVLDLDHPFSNYGQEDPRLFLFQGRLHVSFTAVERANGKIATRVLYARLSGAGGVEQVFAFDYPRPRKQPWEKNWVFFESRGRLHFVYETSPTHTVVEVDGDRIVQEYRTRNLFPWTGGHRRGGASPVLVGDRWYHWFHGRRGGDWRYNVGVAVFEDRPPFTLVAQTPDPLLWAADPWGNYCPVVFPGGAVLEKGAWTIALGRNDRAIEVAEWDADSVDQLLRGDL